jgi:hypothetical protein
MCEFLSKTFTDAPTFWVMLTGLGTFVLALVTFLLFKVAKKQLTDLAETSAREERTNKADFIFRLGRNFFTLEARQLIFLIEEELIAYENASIPYFKIEKMEEADVKARLEELHISHPTVSTYDVDDILLGPLEDVGIFKEAGLISLDDAYEEFDYYIQLCVDNDQIRKYIDDARSEPESSDVYENVLNLAVELKIYGKSKRTKIGQEKTKSSSSSVSTS